jgi:hypothetical protein
MYGRVGNVSNFVEGLFGENNYRRVADNITNGSNASIFELGANTPRASSNVWYVGANLNVTLLDPLLFGMDAAYGSMSKANYGMNNLATNRREFSTKGWYMAATLDYRMSWGTPGIFGWYASGDKTPSNSDVANGRLKGGRLPAMMNHNESFNFSSFGGGGRFPLSTAIAGGGAQGPVTLGSFMGTWGIGAQVANMSFVKDLRHTARVMYYQGTNKPGMVRDRNMAPAFARDTLYLTTKDSAFEVTLDNQYRIYEHLTAVLELGYINLRSNKNVWERGVTNSDTKRNDNAWKAVLGFRYQF